MPVGQKLPSSFGPRAPFVRLVQVGAVLAATVVLAAAVTSPATQSASVERATMHIGLKSSTPAMDAHLMEAPTEIRLTFTGPVDVKEAGVELRGPDSSMVALAPLAAVPDSAQVAVAKITGAMKGGTYYVHWRATAADGAPGSGTFSFMYMAPAGK